MAKPPLQELGMWNLIRRLVKDESGATAVEYGLIAAAISLAIIAIFNSIGSLWIAYHSSHLGGASTGVPW
jgi:pilus assembly protein Flp/PilA